MAEPTAGKRLSKARLARGLTLDAAAHATRMRPDKILALENDDLTRFGSSVYAKGFLLMYGRFLKVDVSAELEELKGEDNSVNVQEYQYLNNAPPPPKQVELVPLHRRKPKGPSVVPLLAFLTLCGLGVGGLWIWGYVHRLGLDRAADSQTVEIVPPKGEGSIAAGEPSSAGSLPPVAVAEVPAADPAEAAPLGSETASDAPPADNELSVESLKKTVVTIRKDRNSPPLFDGDIYPNGKLLKVHGPTFFIEVRDETAVRIRKNGQLIAYQSPGIVVQ